MNLPDGDLSIWFGGTSGCPSIGIQMGRSRMPEIRPSDLRRNTANPGNSPRSLAVVADAAVSAAEHCCAVVETVPATREK